MIIPIMQALSNDAKVPAIIAFKPKAAILLFLIGAKDPNVPIRIPIEAKLANPDKKYVDIIIDF